MQSTDISYNGLIKGIKRVLNFKHNIIIHNRFVLQVVSGIIRNLHRLGICFHMVVLQ